MATDTLPPCLFDLRVRKGKLEVEAMAGLAQYCDSLSNQAAASSDQSRWVHVLPSVGSQANCRPSLPDPVIPFVSAGDYPVVG